VTMSRRQLAFAAGLVPVLVWAAVGTPAFVAELSTPCPTGICATFERPTPEAVGFYAALGISPFGYALAVTVLAWAQLLLAAAVALLLPRSRSGGLLVAVTAVLLPVLSATGFGAALATRSTVGQVLDVAAGVVVGILTPLLFGLFPDGRWHPRWFRWAWVGPAAVSTVSLAVPGLGDSDAVAFAELASWLLLVGIQVHRYRRADWTGRQQTKLVLLAVVLVVANLVLGTLADLAGLVGAYQPVAVLLDYAALGALNVGLLVALFRFRLYDADLALRRTAVYASALVALAAVYVGLVAAAAPALSAAAVGVLALAGGVAVFALRERLRRRLFGGHGLARAIAAVARDPAPRADLAATIAQGLGLPYAAVYDRDGELVCEHGERPSEPHRESVVDGDGAEVGSLVLGAPRGTRRLDRHHRRVFTEVLPFVVLVLRARAEAQALRAARAAAAGAREDERRRLRRDLHDGVGPLLATQLLILDTHRVTGRPELLVHLEEQARAAVGEVRRVAHDLRPAVLDAGGLPAGLAAEAERVGAAGLPVELVVDLGRRAGPDRRGRARGGRGGVGVLRCGGGAAARGAGRAAAGAHGVPRAHGAGARDPGAVGGGPHQRRDRTAAGVAAQDRAQLRRERARQDPRRRPGGRGVARPPGRAGLRGSVHVELCSRTTPTVTSSKPPRSKSRLSWSALIVAVSPSNGP
jgi:two-component system NarL family sensor kinase